MSYSCVTQDGLGQAETDVLFQAHLEYSLHCKFKLFNYNYNNMVLYRAGVAFFEAAIQAGTDDLRTLSAIYSQLGNAYFYLGEYTKAMQYHKHDLTLAR